MVFTYSYKWLHVFFIHSYGYAKFVSNTYKEKETKTYRLNRKRKIIFLKYQQTSSFPICLYGHQLRAFHMNPQRISGSIIFIVLFPLHLVGLSPFSNKHCCPKRRTMKGRGELVFFYKTSVQALNYCQLKSNMVRLSMNKLMKYYY